MRHSFTYRLLNFLSRQPLKIGRFFAHTISTLAYYLNVSKTSNVINLNLQITLPELTHAQRSYIIKNAVRNEITSYFEFFSIWGADNQKNIQRIHSIHGEHLLHKALVEKKGLVLIVPHFGTWEIMNAWVAQFTQMTILYKPVKNPIAEQFVLKARAKEQANLVPTDESGVRQIFRALKNGGTTVILPDHSPNQAGEMVPYFGIPLLSSNLSAKLIQKTKAKALFLYALRNEKDGFDMFIEEIDNQIYQGDANYGTFIIHQAIEKLIQKYPEHYHWSYKRFKAHLKLKQIYNINQQEALSLINKIRKESSF